MKNPLDGSEGQCIITFNAIGILIKGDVELSYNTAFVNYRRFLVENPLSANTHKIETQVNWSTSNVVDPVDTASDLLILKRIKDFVFEDLIKSAQRLIIHSENPQTAKDFDIKFCNLVR